MIIRIPLTEKNCTISPIPLEDNPARSDLSDSSDLSDRSDRWVPSALDGFELPVATFTLAPGELTAYESSRYSHPVASVNVSVPDADLPLVNSWFGNTSSGVSSASDTLIKRMTDAVTGCIETYLTAAARASLFTAPFRVGYALRIADGTHVCRSTPRLLCPNPMAPLMLIRERKLSDNMLQTLTEIVNVPSALSASLPAFSLPQGAEGLVTHLDFYATRQTALLTGDETVAGVRTYAYFGENVPCWHYPRLAEDLVKEAATADSSFRVIASVPIAEAVKGLGGITLPLDMKNLDNWSDFPALDSEPTTKPDTPTDPDNPDDPEIPHTHILLETEPLDLGLPETAKKIRALTVRGIFPRSRRVTIPIETIANTANVNAIETGKNPPEGGTVDVKAEIEVTVYGSHHRERWHRIATSRGPHVRYLRTVRYRWLRVSITAPRSSTPDALVFTIA
jgi:hypothetical protein